MSSTGKSAGAKDEKLEAMPFETALKKLESIVEAMEEGELPLESLLTKYEEGTRLVRACQAKLAEAELKIAKLEKADDGEAALRPISAQATEEEP